MCIPRPLFFQPWICFVPLLAPPCEHWVYCSMAEITQAHINTNKILYYKDLNFCGCFDLGLKKKKKRRGWEGWAGKVGVREKP